MLMQWLDLILHVDAKLLELSLHYGPWVFAILFLIVFCETGLVIAPFLPGDSLLFVVGALAAQGLFSPWLMGLTLLAAAFLGDNLNYWIGRKLGHRLFANPKSKIFRHDRLTETHAFFERHGGKTLVMARFVPIVRTFAPFVAGMGEMDYLRFMAFSFGGGTFWVGSLVTLGYCFGNLPIFKNHLSSLVLAVVGLSLLPLVIKSASHAWKNRSKNFA